MLAATTTPAVPRGPLVLRRDPVPRLHDSLGFVKINVDGVEVLNVSGLDTKNAGTGTTYDTVQFGMGLSGTTLFDDLYLMAGAGDSFLGDCIVTTLLPNGNGASVGGTFGAPQYMTFAGVPDNNGGNYELGNKVRFTTGGRITKVRYYRLATTSAVDVSVWNTAGTRVAGPVASPAGAAGYVEVTLPAPLAVTPNEVLTVSVGGTLVPWATVATTVTNATDYSMETTTLYDAVGVAPASPGTGTFYVAPVFEAVGSGFTGSDGDSTDNYLLVDEVPPSGADYVSSSTIGAQDLYTMSNLPAAAGEIIAVAPTLFAAKDEVGPRQVKPLIRSTTTVAGAGMNLDFAYAQKQVIHSVNPDTGLPWTMAEVNAVQVGVEVA